MQIKALGQTYPFPTRPLELGEQRRLKREFGFVFGQEDLDLNDPDHIAALLYAAMREATPDAPVKGILAAIDRVREIEILGDDGKPLGADEEADADVQAAGDPPQTEGETGS